MKRITTSVTLASGGLAAAASVAMGVAAANPDATTVSVPNPFGVTYNGEPTFTYQTGNAYQDIAYGHQTINLDSSQFQQAIDQFFTSSGVTVDGEPFGSAGTSITANDLPATIIDKAMSYGYQEQQILLPSVPGTNIDSGVIDLHNFGGGFGYLYIDLVGPGTTHLNSNGVDHAVGVLLVTPTGTYDVSSWENGGDYGDMAYMESQLFDHSENLPNLFGFTLQGEPDVTYQTGDVLGSTAYGSQDFEFDSSGLAPDVEKFFTDNVTVDGQPVSADNPLIADGQAHVIDTIQYNGLFDGLTQQQILLPSIEGTNIDHGVIDIHNYGNGFGYDYIDLVGTSGHDAVGAWLVTPMGNFDVSPWAGLEAQMFDASAFDPNVFFPGPDLAPPFNFWF